MFVVEEAAEVAYTPEQVFGLMSDIRNELKVDAGRETGPEDW